MRKPIIVNIGNQAPEEFRIDLFMSSMKHIDFGNCGVPTELQDFLLRNKKSIEDIFLGDDSLYILPKTRDIAKELLSVCMGEEEYNDPGYYRALADDISWIKLGDRYYLSLWWD